MLKSYKVDNKIIEIGGSKRGIPRATNPLNQSHELLAVWGSDKSRCCEVSPTYKSSQRTDSALVSYGGLCRGCAYGLFPPVTAKGPHATRRQLHASSTLSLFLSPFALLRGFFLFTSLHFAGEGSSVEDPRLGAPFPSLAEEGALGSLVEGAVSPCLVQTVSGVRQ